jgi:hypothetical protein
MDIRCRKLLCKYNDRFVCRAKEILVDGKVVCSTYEKDKSKTELQDVTKHLFEMTPTYAPQRDSKALKISCKADCLFNHNGKCVSNGITLNAIKEKPYCVSFLKS